MSAANECTKKIYCQQVRTGKGKHQIVNGILLPSEVKANNLRHLQVNFATRTDDVFVVTYPKCGTTWMQQIVKLIWNKGKEDGRDIDEVFPWAEMISTDTAATLASPRGFKSHLPYHMLPGGQPALSQAKYIYVYRNPKDAVVSGYYHTKGLLSKEATWDSYFDQFLTERVVFGPILDHVLGWWKHRDADNILILSYENMKKDLPGTICTIADFMGCTLTQENIACITQQTTFSAMKQNPSANMSWTDQQRADGLPPFMRKGVVGDWKNHFSDEQSARMDAEITQKMMGSGLEFDYNE